MNLRKKETEMTQKAKVSGFIIIAAVLIATFAIALPATYAEQTGPVVLETRAEKVDLAVDKNGNPYARIVFKKEMTVEGIEVEVETLLMCFGETYTGAKSVRPGETIRVVAIPSHYKGRVNYNALKFVR